LEGKFGGACKVETHLEVLLELSFSTKPPNFGVEAHMVALAGVALWANPNPTLKHEIYTNISHLDLRVLFIFQLHLNSHIPLYF
jgi:hypothetical protein